MADGASISPDQGEGRTPIGKTDAVSGGENKLKVSPPAQEQREIPVPPLKDVVVGKSVSRMEELEAREAERRAYFDNLFWENVQEEAAGKPTDLTRPGVSSIESRAVALAAKEGLLSDPNREDVKTLITELNRGKGIGTEEQRRQRIDQLLSQLRNSQGKPPVIPTPPQAPQQAIEVKKGFNPLKMFRKKP